MMSMGLYMKPWINLMESIGATPRGLADDMLISQDCPKHVEQIQEALNLTHQCLDDIGSVIAQGKSAVFTNDEEARKWYRTHKWPSTQSTIHVTNRCRDLGAHISTATVTRSSRLTTRLRDVANTLQQLMWLPILFHDKAKAIRTYGHTKALYGCETTRPSKNSLNAYTTKVLDNIYYKSGNQSADFTFVVASRGRTLTRTGRYLSGEYQAYGG